MDHCKIKSWQHKGIKEFFFKGKKQGIMPAHAKKLKIILQRLNAAMRARDMDTPGMAFHELKDATQTQNKATQTSRLTPLALNLVLLPIDVRPRYCREIGVVGFDCFFQQAEHFASLP